MAREQRRENGRERYQRQIRELREGLNLTHDEARRRWSDYFQPGGIPIKPIRRVQLAIRASATKSGFCPFCRDDFSDGSPTHECACKAQYHKDCFEENLGGRCATLGCTARHAVSRSIAAARIRILVRREEEAQAIPEPRVSHTTRLPQRLPTQLEEAEATEPEPAPVESPESPQTPSVANRMREHRSSYCNCGMATCACSPEALRRREQDHIERQSRHSSTPSERRNAEFSEARDAFLRFGAIVLLIFLIVCIIFGVSMMVL